MDKLWQINWEELSNERLLDLWLNADLLDADEKATIEKILVQRVVIRECAEDVDKLLAEQKPACAPEAPKTTNLSFSEALEAMKAGKKVRRKDFNETLSVSGAEIEWSSRGETYPWEPEEGVAGILANDWQIVE